MAAESHGGRGLHKAARHTNCSASPIMTNPQDIPPFDSMGKRDETSDRDAPPASALDDERLASMADEGGVSGALMEIEDLGERKRLMQAPRKLPLPWRKAAAAVALLGLAVFALGWLRRNA